MDLTPPELSMSINLSIIERGGKTDKAGLKARKEVLIRFHKYDCGGTLDWILDQKETLMGKSGKIQTKSGVS